MVLVATVPLAALAIIGIGYAENLTASSMAEIIPVFSQHNESGVWGILNIFPVTGIPDETNGVPELRHADGIAIAEISGSTYTLVTTWIPYHIHIINITDPASPFQVTKLTAGIDGFGEISAQRCETIGNCRMLSTEINGSAGASRCSCSVYKFDDYITITEISDRTYAAVATRAHTGVQIIDITNPAAPAPVAWIGGDRYGFSLKSWFFDLAIANVSDRTYVLVATLGDEEDVKIFDITNPAVPVLAAGLTGEDFELADLNGVQYVVTAEISGRTYALVTTSHPNSIHIIDINDPTAPVQMARLMKDTDGFTHIPRFGDIATAEISGRTYALIISDYAHTGGVQIIDINDPTTPVPVTWIPVGADGFAEWEEPRNIAITEISGRTYALITAFNAPRPWMPLIGSDGISPEPPWPPPIDGVQVIDITDPTFPVPVAWLTDDVGGFMHLDNPHNIAITEISNTTYALVTTSEMGGGVQIIGMTLP